MIDRTARTVWFSAADTCPCLDGVYEVCLSARWSVVKVRWRGGAWHTYFDRRFFDHRSFPAMLWRGLAFPPD